MIEKEMIVRCNIVREPGFLYYIAKDGNVWRVKMARGRKRKELTQE